MSSSHGTMKDVLAVVLAGGVGERLYPLTRHRAKPAVPFGGQYRLIDFTLSNCINSQCRRVMVLVQYKHLSLSRHIRHGWNIFHPSMDEFIEVISAQKRVGEDWYQGTADAIYQNMYSIDPVQASEVLVLAGDHIYKMDYSRMVEYHRRNNADVTVAAIQMPLCDANRFGVLEMEYTGRITGFQEKPAHPTPVPGHPDTALASMGVYVFSTDVLKKACADDHERHSSHDFGKDIIPGLVDSHRVFAYMFQDENKKDGLYWRDVGTLESYWEANMDLIQVDPIFNLYDKDWPIHTYFPDGPPAKFVFAHEGVRYGAAVDSIVGAGSIISGGIVKRSIIGPDVRVNSYSSVKESILFQGATVGRHARIRRAIVEKNVVIPENTTIGYDLEEDKRRFHVTPHGIVVVTGDALIGKGAGVLEPAVV